MENNIISSSEIKNFMHLSYANGFPFYCYLFLRLLILHLHTRWVDRPPDPFSGNGCACIGNTERSASYTWYSKGSALHFSAKALHTFPICNSTGNHWPWLMFRKSRLFCNWIIIQLMWCHIQSNVLCYHPDCSPGCESVCCIETDASLLPFVMIFI